MITSIDNEKCTGCGNCVRKCTLDVFSLNTKQPYVSPCMALCPCGVDIRGIMHFLQQDMQEEALALLKQSIPFPALTSHLCAHHCEDGCIRQPKGEYVDICGLERYLGMLDAISSEECVAESVHLAKVAVIGGGLAGMSCAYFLRTLGYIVELFEEKNRLGGHLQDLAAKGMPSGLIAYCENKLRAMGVSIRLSLRAGANGNLSLQDLVRRDFRAICITIGKDVDLSSLFPEIMPTDRPTGRTSRPEVFAAGACIGAVTAEEATAQAHNAALLAHGYLSGVEASSRCGRAKVAHPLPPALPTYPSGIAERKDTWESTMTLEDVQRASLRCCTCGAKAYIAHPDDCMTCFTCEIECPAGAVSVHPFKEVLPRTLDLWKYGPDEQNRKRSQEPMQAGE